MYFKNVLPNPETSGIRKFEKIYYIILFLPWIYISSELFHPHTFTSTVHYIYYCIKKFRSKNAISCSRKPQHQTSLKNFLHLQPTVILILIYNTLAFRWSIVVTISQTNGQWQWPAVVNRIVGATSEAERIRYDNKMQNEFSNRIFYDAKSVEVATNKPRSKNA